MTPFLFALGGLIVCLLVAVVALQALILRRQRAATVDPLTQLAPHFATLERAQERTERSLRDESLRHRDEAGQQAHHLRAEVAEGARLDIELRAAAAREGRAAGPVADAVGPTPETGRPVA